jgi:hypothetical protein
MALPRLSEQYTTPAARPETQSREPLVGFRDADEDFAFPVVVVLRRWVMT